MKCEQVSYTCQKPKKKTKTARLCATVSAEEPAWVFGLNGTSCCRWSLPIDKEIRRYLLPCGWVQSSTGAHAKGIPVWKIPFFPFLPIDKEIRYLLPCRWVKSSTRAHAKGIAVWKIPFFRSEHRPWVPEVRASRSAVLWAQSRLQARPRALGGAVLAVH